MLRVLAGIAVGLGYGVLVGGAIFLLDLITGDSDQSVLMIDPKAIFRALLLLAMTVTGSAGAVVGLLVAVLRTEKTKAAMIGFCTGLLVLAGIVVKIWPQLDVSALSVLLFLVLIIVFPVGLGATGVVAAQVSNRLQRRSSPTL
jgi:hypothetical protein